MEPRLTALRPGAVALPTVTEAASELAGVRGPRAPGVAGVRRALRLDEEHLRLLLGLGAMLDPARHDEELTLFEEHVTVAQVNREPSADDEEEVVGVVVLVPDERGPSP